VSVRKKIHEDNDFNHAEKVAENLLHWVIVNKQMFFIILAVIALVIAGIMSFNYIQKKNLDDAKTEYGRIFIEMQKSGKYNPDALMSVYENSNEKVFAGLAAYQLGMLSLDNAKYQDAIDWFDKALTKKPAAEFIVSSIYEGKGVALEFLGSKPEALENYAKALEVKKSSYRRSDVRMKIALLKRNTGDVASAKKECEAIVADTLATPEMIQNAKNLLLAL